MIQIRSLSAHLRDFRIHPQIRIVSSAGSHVYSRFLHVVVEDNDGCRGWGEAATTLQWSGENAEMAQLLLERIFVPALRGITLSHPSEAAPLMDRLTQGHPFLKGAVDCALWDLFARKSDRSVASLVRTRSLPARLPSRASIGMFPVRETAAAARFFWEAGIRTLKFKTGLPGTLDQERLKTVREELGNEPVFTVDYNGRFRCPKEALLSILSWEKFSIALVEQPTHRDGLHLLAEVRKHCPVPVIADESIFTPDDLEEALSLEACDVVCLYPGKNAGLTTSLAMADRCAEAGLSCVAGSNLETNVGLAATLTMAAAHPAFPVAEIPGDFASGLYYEQHTSRPDLFLENGSMPLPNSPGFGVEPSLG